MSARRPRLAARKQPKQQRSRETVEAILHAATYILATRGYDAMTTNQVADRAGVNIASLYQYFPNKQALVGELARRHAAKTRAAFVAVFERTREARFEDGIRAMIEAVAAEHAIDPRLHEELTRIAPQLGLAPPETEFDAAIEAARAAYVRTSRLPDPALALWVAQTAIHAVFHTAFLERPEIASQPALVEELVRLVTGYLAPARGSHRVARKR